MESKEKLRDKFQSVAVHPECFGKIAETFRRLESFKNSRQVFITPAVSLAQIRINALLDGKELIMPGPSIREGFYLLKPFSVPFPKLSLAVSHQGVAKYGRLLKLSEMGRLDIGLLVTDAISVDNSGSRLGDGSGFFDLSCAIFSYCQALGKESEAYAVLDSEERISETLPTDEWDIQVQGCVTPKETVIFKNRLVIPDINWQQLSERRIKKITPLWQIYRSLFPG